ncbi:MAG: hypothetical protein ACLFP4_11905 [Spirochaetales bacterium]
MRKLLPIAVLSVLLVTSCENFFTNSPFSAFRRDPASMSEAQKQAFARDVLASGDRAAMEEAYNDLKESEDPETQLLAADLAIGAVGLDSAFIGAVGDLESGADAEATIDAAIESFEDDDFTMLAEAAALVDEADASSTPTPEQYLYAAVAMIAVAANQNGGATGLDSSHDPAVETSVTQAQEFLDAAYAGLQAAGESTELLDSLGAGIGWTP